MNSQAEMSGEVDIDVCIWIIILIAKKLLKLYAQLFSRMIGVMSDVLRSKKLFLLLFL